MVMTTGGLEVTTYQPPPGFDPLTADAADLQKFGFPPRQDDPRLQARYENVLNRLKGKFNYIPATLQRNAEVFHGPRSRLPSAATETSTNWSGGVVYAPSGQSFSCIEGDWVVPDIDAPTENQWYYCATWIGLDGDGSGDVCQAGIGSQVYRSGTSVTSQFYAWWEWYPEPEVQITNFPVSPGDMITALITASPGAGATKANVYLTNRTTGASTSLSFTAPGNTTLSGNCAEWITEAPTVGGQQSSMADFGEVFFSVCEAGTNSTLVGGGTGDNINEINSGGAVVVDGNLITSTIVQCEYVGILP
jgi:hypothetical protein